jgi:signal transduction histidine kinase
VAVACTPSLALCRPAALVTAPHVLASAVGQAFDGLHPAFALVIAAQIAAYAFAAYAALLLAALGGLTALLALWIALWPLAPSANDLSWVAIVIAVPWISGRVVRDQRDQRRQLEVMATQLEHERDASAQLAVAEERARLARELHRAIARAVDVMIAQAASAEAALGASPARARRALRAVQETGRREITEMRRMLRILRTDHERRPPDEAPQSEHFAGRVHEPIGRFPRLDLVLGVGCLVIVEVWVIVHHGFSVSERLVSALLAVPATLPLVWRRRTPLAVLLIIAASVGLQQTLVNYDSLTPIVLIIAPLMAVYTLAAHASVKRALSGIAPSILVAAAASGITEGKAWEFAAGIVFHSVYAAGPFLCGRAVRLHRRQADQLRILTGRLKRERDARVRLAVLDERTRVARELHDSIAHGVSVMVLQAGAAEQVLAAEPEQARRATRAVQDAGRTALRELRPLLGGRARHDGDDQRSATPSLTELDALIEKVRRTGLSVDVQVRGSSPPLSAGVDACAYRVIQEGLTNALKHGAARAAAVILDFRPDALTIEIVNVVDGASSADERGHGLIGMRERVELYGGVLRAGPRSDGRYAVWARLPLGGDGS